MTEYAVQSKSDDHADAAKPTSIWMYDQLSEQRSVHLSFACLTPIPETSGFASIVEVIFKQSIGVGRVQLAAMSSRIPTMIGNCVLHERTVFARFMTWRENAVSLR